MKVEIDSMAYMIGTNIKKWREARNMTRTELGQIVDLDNTVISKYENGVKGVMRCELLCQFAKALHVSMEQLMDKEEADKESTETEFEKEFQSLCRENQEMILHMISALRLQERMQAQCRK